MYNKDCIHCGRKMSCDEGVAHHECSRLAQQRIDELEKNIDYLKELEKLIKKNKVYFELKFVGQTVGPNDITAVYSGNNMNSQRSGGSREFSSIKNALYWIIFGKEEDWKP